RRHQRKPCDAHRDLQPGEDERQCTRHDDVPEDLPTARAETGGGARVRWVDRLHAQHGIERGRVERRERGEEYYWRLVGAEHHDGERNPREDRDRPQGLEHRKGELTEVARPPEEEAE